VQIQITPVRDERGEVTKFVSIQTDSTELRRTQQQLEAAKRRAEAANEAKTRFLATISHEMRTPLNAILGSTDLVLDGAMDAAGMRAHLARINDSGHVLLRLISDLLDLSKIEAGQIDVERNPVDIRACLGRSVAAIADRARAKGLDFELVCDRSLPEFMLGDPDRLRQIVTNLAENAVKFTEIGYVRIEANRVAAATGDGIALEIRVVDSGIGIAEEVKTRIFDRFVQGDGSTTRRKGGAGLGLSIVKSLVEAMGGSVTVRSRVGGGADFRATVPIVAVAGLSGPPSVHTPSPAGRTTDATSSTARILVAEDNDAGFAVLDAYLRRAGYTVERACDGREAIAAASRCDLILMDLEMPEMDGLEATQRIRASEREAGSRTVPILALTAHALQEYRERCLAAGCSGYLSKPIRMQALLDAVVGALVESSATAPTPSDTVGRPGPGIAG
jgi:signal transduction histidine kinase/ActR/RegA family two-component response regulator